VTDLPDIYRRLHDHFGYRNWWPGDTPFEIVIGAILTQNTNWHNVERAISNLKASNALSPEAIIALPDDDLKVIIRSAGFFNQKAERLKSICRWWLVRSGSPVDTGTLRRELLAIKGIGPETADCILLYALGKPVFVIDAYTTRALARLGLSNGRVKYEQLRAWFQRQLPPDPALYNDFHAQWVALGKEYCRMEPKCLTCPLREICEYGKRVSA